MPSILPKKTKPFTANLDWVKDFTRHMRAEKPFKYNKLTKDNIIEGTRDHFQLNVQIHQLKRDLSRNFSFTLNKVKVNTPPRSIKVTDQDPAALLNDRVTETPNPRFAQQAVTAFRPIPAAMRPYFIEHCHQEGYANAVTFLLRNRMLLDYQLNIDTDCSLEVNTLDDTHVEIIERCTVSQMTTIAGYDNLVKLYPDIEKNQITIDNNGNPLMSLTARSIVSLDPETLRIKHDVDSVTLKVHHQPTAAFMSNGLDKFLHKIKTAFAQLLVTIANAFIRIESESESTTPSFK